MKFFKAIAIFALLLFSIQFSFSQTSTTDNERFIDRITVGGNVGLSFGSTTYIEADPQVGYRITDNWTSGVSAKYVYVRQKIYDYYGALAYTYKSSIYGGGVFSRYNIYKGVFADAEFEDNNLDAYTLDHFDQFGNPFYTSGRAWIPSLLLGGGYAQSIGGKSSFFLCVLYDVLQNPNSPYYGVPVIRGGVSFGL